jgi:chromosome segregation and condensation protein ScpB
VRFLDGPLTIADVTAIRGVESAGTIQTLHHRKLIARGARLGPHREKFWRTTDFFLQSFGLASIDELYQEGRLEQAFPSVYGTASLDEEEEPDVATPVVDGESEASQALQLP